MKIVSSLLLMLFTLTIYSQNKNPAFGSLDFLVGNWQGVGKGFGNEGSSITATFQYDLNGQFMELTNESVFQSTNERPDGNYHKDKGYLSFDKQRERIVLRQFHTEGFVNQYVLFDSLDINNRLVFKSESIENFTPKGKTRWTIEKINSGHIISSFFVSFDGEKYSCTGVNELKKN